MTWATCAVVLMAGGPLAWAWLSLRGSTLRHAIGWALAAWIAWLLAYWMQAAATESDAELLRYVALSLTGCAGIAVLGARRPGVAAWHLVVAGLLAVFLLPVAQRWGRPPTSGEFQVFLGVTLALGLLNYLPTRQGPAAFLAGIGCWFALRNEQPLVVGWCLGLVPWVALLCRRRTPAVTEADELWLTFRDRFGVVWSQRLREQLNRACANHGWPVFLHWHGFECQDGADRGLVTETFRAMLKRFS